jgi:Ser/Thr protein kinase RdoA (MazF antagonist)
MFPTNDSNLQADALVQQVLVHYPIGKVARCRFHRLGLNDTYKVETSDGKSYFLRVYRARWRTREEIETELGVLQHLARCDVSVSVPVDRTDRESLTLLDCAEGTRWAALFTAAPGNEVDYEAYTEEQADRFGGIAAAIHAAANSFEGRPLRAALDLELLLERPLALLESTISHRADDRSYLANLGRRLRGTIESTAGLEIGFCHGDFHGRNACYAGDIVTVFDFDCCGWGYRAYDLSVFPWAFAVGESAPGRVESMGRAFLKGYMRCRSFRQVDIDAIPVFAAIRQIWLIGLHIGLADRFGWGGLNDRYFDRQLKVLRDWEKNFLDRPVAEWLPSGQ